MQNSCRVQSVDLTRFCLTSKGGESCVEALKGPLGRVRPKPTSLTLAAAGGDGCELNPESSSVTYSRDTLP